MSTSRKLQSSSEHEQLSMGKLAKINQEDEYRQMMGEEAFERQKRLANLEQGKCICTPRKIKRKWDGADKPITRPVHDQDCPKYKIWMKEVYDK